MIWESTSAHGVGVGVRLERRDQAAAVAVAHDDGVGPVPGRVLGERRLHVPLAGELVDVERAVGPEVGQAGSDPPAVGRHVDRGVVIAHEMPGMSIMFARPSPALFTLET